MRRRVSCSLALAALLGGGSAVASTTYPAALQTDLGLAKPPSCAVCHAAATAPVGAVDQRFGQSLVARGLGSGDPASLASALDRLRQDGVDSDGDGAQDLDELAWGGDPNHADLPPTGYQEPVSYGCSMTRMPVGENLGWLTLSLVSGLMMRRRRRRLPPRG